jgi:uncharacterized protein YjbJ (UPF0337 family)
MLEFTKKEGFDDEAVAEIQARIDKLQKEMNKEPPPGHVLESTIQLLERATKRHSKAQEALGKAPEEVVKRMEAVQQYEDKVNEAETRLEQVKAEHARGNGDESPQLSNDSRNATASTAVATTVFSRPARSTSADIVVVLFLKRLDLIFEYRNLLRQYACIVFQFG